MVQYKLVGTKHKRPDQQPRNLINIRFGTENVTLERLDMQHLYFILMALIGFACIMLGWDSINGVPLFQIALIFGGAVLGHVTTEALNAAETEE